MKYKPFRLPPNWYRDTISHLVDNVLPPQLGRLDASTAWRYLYACVLWSQSVDSGEYLHLNDQLTRKLGQELAIRGQEYLENYLALNRETPVASLIDQIAGAYRAERVRQNASPSFQRNNITGTGMETTLQVLVERVCGARPFRTPRLHTLRGFELAPVGYHSRPDLVLFTPQDFRMLISTKWTLRKERIGTYLHEAYFYKQRRSDLQIAFVISEFNLNIIEWLVSDPLVDRVYHVHLPMLLAVHQPFRQSDSRDVVAVSKLLNIPPDQAVQEYARWLNLATRLFDLSQLFADIDRLKAETIEPLFDEFTEETGGDEE